MVEVLFVDDHLTEIEPVALALHLRTGLDTKSTDKADEALDIVRDENIKVAVLDQRMEELLGMTGTDLYRQIKTVDPRVRGIVYSGESEKADVIAANSLGMRYLDRGTSPEELAREVLEQRAVYLAELEREYQASAIVVGRFRGNSSRFRGIRQLIELLAIEDISDNPEPLKDGYTTILEIGSGQDRRTTKSVTTENEVVIDTESLTEFEGSLGLPLNVATDVSARLRSALRERTKMRTLVSTEDTYEESITLSTTDQRAGVIHSRIEAAALYHRRRALLRVTCECCGGHRVIPLPLREWSGRYHRRRIDVYRDETERTYDLGERL